VPAGRREESETIAAESVEVLDGFDALVRVSEAICGRSVARSPAEAEGLALAGLPAASLSDGVAYARGGGIPPTPASCVHHVRSDPGRESLGVFEFAAGSVQDAIDQSLAAHRLSRALGRPGLCSLDPSLGNRLGLVRVPRAALITEALAADGDSPPAAGADGLLEGARGALRAVAEHTGRPADVIECSGDAGAEWALVGWGAAAGRCREAAGALGTAGVPARAVVVNLVRPFPGRDVRSALAGARNVLVVEGSDAGERLLERVRAVVDGDPTIHRADPQQVFAVMGEHLPAGALDRLAARPPVPQRRLLALPAGPWGEATARGIAALLGRLGPLRLASSLRRRRGASLLAWESDALAGRGADLMVASEAGVLEPRALGLLRPGGAVVLQSAAAASDELAERLRPEIRTLLRERDLSVVWVPAAGVDGEAEGADTLALAGGVLVALASDAEAPDAATAEQVADRLEEEGAGTAARCLREAARSARILERKALDPSRYVEEVDFRPQPTLPRLPAPVDDPAERERWAARIRRFHRTGRPAPGAASWRTGRAAALHDLAGSGGASRQHPFVVIPPRGPEDEVGARSLRGVLAEATDAVRGAGREGRVLGDNLERLALLTSRLLGSGGSEARLGRLLEEAGERLVGALALSGEGERVLVEELAELRRHVPEDGAVFDLSPDMPLDLLRVVLEAVRAPLLQRFTEELDQLREQLRDLLQLDRMASGEGRAADALAASLGSTGGDRLDPDALARTLPARPGSEPLAPERRQRIERTLRILDAHLDEPDALPGIVLLRPPGLRAPAPGFREQQHANPLVAAIGLFDGLAARMTAVLAAARVARLEAAGHYRPELHDEPLAALDWEALTAAELNLLPVVVTVTTGRRVREGEQAALSELLRSSRPVHVMVLDEVAADDEAEDLSRFHVDLGYWVMAHREALALGSSLARPERLTADLARAARAVRPAVILVSFPALQPAAWRPMLAEAALWGRAAPEFRYDPDQGPSWADRFDLRDNPQPERAWPLRTLACLEDGSEKPLEVNFTFADAVAHEPAYRRHLQVIPRAAWNEGQIPLAEYLDRVGPESREPWIPYLWWVDDRGILQRAVVTRALAMACADRRRSWRVLQELAGYENVFAQRAAVEAQTEAEARHAELAQSHGEALERARWEGAHESMERLAAVLMSGDGLATAPLPALPPAAAPSAAPVAPIDAQPAPAETAPEEEEEEEALSFAEPYIDSALCTSCNECTDLNGQLFRYNADKQAVIGDPKAGTFAELVKAAELCPARCIHPGQPRSDDSTATAELIERAAAFN
jgi:ferredoxin